MFGVADSRVIINKTPVYSCDLSLMEMAYSSIITMTDVLQEHYFWEYLNETLSCHDNVQDATSHHSSIMEKTHVCGLEDKCVFILRQKPAHPASDIGVSLFQRI